MSQVPWMVDPKQKSREPLTPEAVMYRVIESGFPGPVEKELNHLARLGFRVVATVAGSRSSLPLIILELCETVSLTAEGDQALSEHLSI